MDMLQRVAALVPLFNEAPTDLQTEIFARLPVEFVYRYRLVCKLWNGLFSSNYFLSKWAEVSLNRKQPRLVLCSNIPGIPSVAFCFRRRTWINSSFSLSFMGDWMLSTCKLYCNQSVPGLILVMRSNSLDGRVCNPYTKEFVHIPALLERHYIVFDRMNKTDASYRVVAIGISQRDAIERIERQMVQIYKPSQKRWNIAGYILEDLVVEKTISYHGSFYCHCHTRADETNAGIGFFSIPYEEDGSSIEPNPIPIHFAPFPEIVRNWIRRRSRTLCWPDIITCGSRVLLVAARWKPLQLQEENVKQEIMIWEFITEVEGDPSNSPSWKWVEIARLPSLSCKNWMEKGRFYWTSKRHIIGAGDYVCFVPSIFWSKPTEIVDVATYNLIDHRWGWLPSLSMNVEKCSLSDFPKALTFVPNPRAKVE